MLYRLIPRSQNARVNGAKKLAAIMLGQLWLMGLCGCAHVSQPAGFPEVAALPVQENFPDPLIMQNGQPVTTPDQWFKERRPELKALFQHYMYGELPPVPRAVRSVVTGEFHDFLGGKATLKLVRIETGTEKSAPKIQLMLVIPKQHAARAPVFLAMDFCGNHAITPDPRVPMSERWMGKNCVGCIDHAATEASRGSQATNWPVADIISRGYALATFYSGDIDSDRPEVSDGVYAWLRGEDPGKNNPTNRGTIAAWAWGFQRCVDYLVTDRDIAPSKIAVMGHSRNGKATIVAAAFDERIALAFPHQAGSGGTSPSRGKIGESVKAINDHFPHWFNAKFKEFNEQPEKLPFDQNCLLALCAPRPVLFSAAEQDQWSNPEGQFEVLKAADKVYKFLGAKGLDPSVKPVLQAAGDSFPAGQLGFFMRPGRHSTTVEDWQAFLDFADLQWRSPQKVRTTSTSSQK